MNIYPYLINNMMITTNENTLYLTLKQHTFDAIANGESKIIQREIKENTFKLYLEHDGDDMAFDPDLIEEEPDDLLVYNNGVYPFYPIEYAFINLKVFTEDDSKSDSLTIEVEGISFDVKKNKRGVEERFDYDEEDGVSANKLGSSAFWLITYHLKNIIEINYCCPR